nr:MAG TPA: hypothetical protein [Microviridae sp.]
MLCGHLSATSGVFRGRASDTRKSRIQISDSRDTLNLRSILTSSHEITSQ